jgi:CubicO group peptidase (beta-lactamase class C family)
MTLSRSLVEDAAAYAGEWVEYRQRSALVPGVCVAIRHEDDVVLSRAFGMADVEGAIPLRTDHGFRIASHSKTFTATALMLLVEHGALSLDDRLDRWLQWLPDQAGGLGRAKVREVMSHSAGIIRDGVDAPWWQLRGDFLDVDGLGAAAVGTEPIIARNDRFKYSNIGYSLLGQVIEAVAGGSYHAFVQREIVDRLGLASTGPEPGADSLGRLATGYSARKYGLERRPFAHLDTRAMASATGFYSTAEDLCRYGAAHFLGNEELLSDDSKREMQHEHWKVEGGRGGHYGLGFAVYKLGDRRVIAHGGGFPGFITHTAIDPVDRLVVTVLTNAIDGPAEGLVAGIIGLINRAQKAGPGGAEQDLHRYAGRFFGFWAVNDIVPLGGDLLAIDPELLDPVADATTLEVVDDNTLRISATGGYASFGEAVTYERSPDGATQAVQFAGARLLPLDAYVVELARRTGGDARSGG